MTNQRPSVVTVLAALVAGFMGGAIGNWVAGERPALAQGKDNTPPVLTAKTIRLVDNLGRVRAELTAETSDVPPRDGLFGEPSLRLYGNFYAGDGIQKTPSTIISPKSVRSVYGNFQSVGVDADVRREFRSNGVVRAQAIVLEADGKRLFMSAGKGHAQLLLEEIVGKDRKF